jgi:ABC-type glycerol-3-phosphate transport system substrate-binding protein
VKVYGDLGRISPRDQVVVYWYQQSHGQEEALLELIDEFNASNEWNILVIGDAAGSTRAAYDRVRSEAGTSPGILVGDHDPAATRDAVVELEPYINSPKWGYTQGELGDFLPIALTGERYGWPLYLSTEVLYYNEDWLVESGYTGPPKTWEEFSEMVCAASDPEVGTHGYEFSADNSVFTAMILSRGGRVLNEGADAYAFGGTEGLEALTFIQELLVNGCAIAKAERLGDRADFSTDKVLFTVGSVSGLADYQSDVTAGAGFSWSISLLPTSVETPTVSIHRPSLSILKTAPEKQLAAWLFLKWLTEPQQQARWARDFNYFPMRVSAMDLLKDYLPEHPQYEKALGFLNYSLAVEPGVTGYDKCSEALNEMLTAIADLENPAAWLASTVDKCNASLRAD